MLKLIDIDPSEFSGHSMRHGGATNLAERGVPPYVILAVGRWRSEAYNRYIQASREVRFSWSSSMASPAGPLNGPSLQDILRAPL
jgi:hypothetical protein